MAILNVTPDSFSDGGTNLSVNNATSNALNMIAEGADIIDIGGESTRPGAETVSTQTEISRVIPVIQKIRTVSQIPISIDTTKAEVAEQALIAGANIINDISAATKDPHMEALIKKTKPSMLIMHMQGNPQNMQDNPIYDFVTFEVIDFLKKRIEALIDLGIPKDEIILDPGIGFGKTYQHNLDILKNLDHIMGLHHDVLIGVSRKSIFKKMIQADVDDRVIGTTSVNIWCWQHGVKYFRVHDVKACKQALTAYQTLTGR